MIDILNEINSARRAVGDAPIGGGPGRSVLLRRRFDATIEDVWDACTDPDRIRRWFLPVSGDLRAGGTFQFEGNAGGEILRCEPPGLLKVTWTFQDIPVTEVELRLSRDDGDATLLELEHAWPPDSDAFSLMGVGVGWDGALLGLSLHIRGKTIGDPAAWAESPEARELYTESATAWSIALVDAGFGTAEADKALRDARAFYAPDQDDSETSAG